MKTTFTHTDVLKRNSFRIKVNNSMRIPAIHSVFKPRQQRRHVRSRVFYAMSPRPLSVRGNRVGGVADGFRRDDTRAGPAHESNCRARRDRRARVKSPSQNTNDTRRLFATPA